MKPRVILHNGVSLDGRMDWGTGDIGLYYELAARWNADAMLSGSSTMVAAYSGTAIPDEDPVLGAGSAGSASVTGDGDTRPLLVVIDSRGRINNWIQIRQEPYWKDVIILCSHSTPQEYLDGLGQKGLSYILAGEGRVDLRAALEALNDRYGVMVLRVDSGGVLNGALLRAGLVDEISVVINPYLVGGISPSSIYVAPDLNSQHGVIPLRLAQVESLSGQAIWLRYEVSR